MPAAGLRHYGAGALHLPLYDVRGGTENLYVLRMLVGVRSGETLQDITLFNLLVPGILRPRQCIIYDCVPYYRVGSIVSGYILSLDGIFNLDGSGYSCWRDFRQFLLGIMVWFYWMIPRQKPMADGGIKCLQEMMDNDRLTFSRRAIQP